MEALTENNLIQNPQEIAPRLFSDFVEWIDRSEKTTRTYITNLRQFMAWLKYAGVKSPTRKDIISYRQWLIEEHEAIQLDLTSATGWRCRSDANGTPIKIKCKPTTAAQYLRSVCQFFKWTAANGLYPDIAANIHAPKVAQYEHKKEAFTASEVLTIEQSILAHSAQKTEAAQEVQKDAARSIQRSEEQGKRILALYLLAVNAGLRTVELSRANIKDLETRRGQTWLYIWGKGRAEADQKKPLSPQVAEAIRDYLKSRTDKRTSESPLFVATGNRSKGKRLAPTTISAMLKKEMQQAGFDSERLTAHSLRHTAGTAIQELTGNIYTTQKYMRHSNPATTEIYLHNNTDQEEAEISKRLYSLYHGEEHTASAQERLHQATAELTPAQLEQLAEYAEKIAKSKPF